MQPVATRHYRSPRDLMRLIASGVLDPETVTSGEESDLLTAFRDKELKLVEKMEAAIGRGAIRAARRTSGQLRRSMAGRYLALWRSKPRHLADRVADLPEKRDRNRGERLRQIISSLEVVGNLSEPATATVYIKKKDRNRAYRYLDAPKRPLFVKSDGSRRVIFKFDWIDKARQRLIARSLTPFANYHSSQFLLRWRNGKRGRSAVCEYLRRELPTLTADHVFVQVDIRDFFGSISATWIEGHFRLPETMIRRQIHSGEMHVLMDRKARAYLPGGENNERVRRVLPQGSALSSLIAEMAMAEVLGGLADCLSDTRVVTYSDNLGIFVPDAQAAVIMDHLRRAFASSGVGPFELSMSDPVPITKEFTFLGHHWQLREGQLHTFVPAPIAEARAIVLLGQMLTSSTRASLNLVRARILAQANEWKFWPGANNWRAELLERWVDACISLGASGKAGPVLSG